VKVKFSSIVWVFFTAAAVTGMPQASSSQAREVVGTTASDVTLFDYSGLTLVAQVHAARIFTDYERKGFFRIGVLPIPVAENVQIQVQAAEGLTNALLALHSWDQIGIGVRRLEFRGFEIVFFGEKLPRIRAASARVGQDGALELSTVSFPDSAEKQTPIPHATLQVAGSSAGWLRWNLDGNEQQVFVFKPTSGKSP
jgi:hypothetical protein